MCLDFTFRVILWEDLIYKQKLFWNENLNELILRGKHTIFVEISLSKFNVIIRILTFLKWKLDREKLGFIKHFMKKKKFLPCHDRIAKETPCGLLRQFFIEYT